jgi:hypothetical protein
MTRFTLARFFLRLHPRVWRHRYEYEVLDLLCRSTVQWRNLFDLLRSAADIWERHLARGRWRPVKVVAVAYVTLLIIWATIGLSGNLLAVMFLEHRYRFLHLDLGFLAAIPAIAVGVMLFFVVGLAVNLPLLSILRLARRYVPVPAARYVRRTV